MRLIDADAYIEYLHNVVFDLIDKGATKDGIALVTSIVHGFEVDLKDETITPTIDPEHEWIPVAKEQILQAGYEGREVRFHIGGRLFAIRELAQ